MGTGGVGTGQDRRIARRGTIDVERVRGVQVVGLPVNLVISFVARFVFVVHLHTIHTII